MAASSCATSVMASLINDGKGQIVTEAEAKKGAADPKDDNIYICIDMGDGTVICIRRPREGKPVTLTVKD